jgi:hypothetical protein
MAALPDALPAAPDALPVLSRGKHKHPSRGACFMEYTALLAGEPFSDTPRCVDRELAAVLRHANDTLADADRRRLLPLLGRAIGLAVRPPASPDGLEPDDATVAAHARTTVRLHRRVSARFMAAIGHVPGEDELRLYDDGRMVDELFWYLMLEPTVLRTSAEYVSRLLERLQLLHECFEATIRDLGLVPVEVAHREPAAPAAPRPASAAVPVTG